MYKPSTTQDFCAQDLELEILGRFRSIVAILPSDCKIFREPWDSSTILCFDFSLCPYQLEIVKEKADILISAAQQLYLGKSIVFRYNNQLKAFRQVS
ncbi:hypothetical protein A5482_006165 [Cyanobacterium sp. IPPAS B-1200]|uniref:hypothetical protein n=1 Tax=Cyanobacterium sp. IPPAS B-1200 TaxID=1562720 RepID=UPI00085260D9|nr:hypothetical protein [Cyanobacterium sp. IPPAS B-1200]OEJ78999.1 hypothetical protein A5482_11510 [Cyanobacterium sp. IPPAS B-1200]